MSKLNYLFLITAVNFPFLALAHGQNVLQTVYIDALVFFALLLFIGFAKWKMNGKMRLILALFTSEFILGLTLGSLPYNENSLMITILSAAIPIVSVLSIYLKFNYKYHEKFELNKLKSDLYLPYIPPLIEASELQALINLESTILIDVRTGPNAKAAYESEHLKGARFVDLDSELAEIPKNAAFGGRHPLPSIEHFAQFLGRLGISPDTHVIVYDDKFGANAAARFWWMLKALGHEKVQVINGGLQAALKNSIPCNSGNETVQMVGAYPANDWNLGRVSMSEVEEATQSNNHIIIDVRDADRYNGLIEPIDLVAGHIPTAINVPFSENLDKNGLFLLSEILNEKYSRLCSSVPSNHVIVHCGSGVTACHTLLAFAHAGLEIPKLYVGSWSEWSRNKDLNK